MQCKGPGKSGCIDKVAGLKGLFPYESDCMSLSLDQNKVAVIAR